MEIFMIAMLFFPLDAHALEHKMVAVICSCRTNIQVPIEFAVKEGEPSKSFRADILANKVFKGIRIGFPKIQAIREYG